MLKRILVALDRSSEASAIFNFALSISQPEISKMLLVHFIDWQIQEVSPWTGLGTLYDINISGDRYKQNRQHLQQKIEQTRHWLQTYVDKANASNISCEADSRVGNCNLGIISLAQSWDADLIIIGRRGHKNLSEILLGSVSNYVIHHAPCSVLVVQDEKILEAKEVIDAIEAH